MAKDILDMMADSEGNSKRGNYVRLGKCLIRVDDAKLDTARQGYPICYFNLTVLKLLVGPEPYLSRFSARPDFKELQARHTPMVQGEKIVLFYSGEGKKADVFPGNVTDRLRDLLGLEAGTKFSKEDLASFLKCPGVSPLGGVVTTIETSLREAKEPPKNSPAGTPVGIFANSVFGRWKTLKDVERELSATELTMLYPPSEWPKGPDVTTFGDEA